MKTVKIIVNPIIKQGDKPGQFLEFELEFEIEVEDGHELTELEIEKEIVKRLTYSIGE